MKTIDINQYLRDHAYPGRGILLGRSADGKSAVIAYFIMGRSDNSRNRIFDPCDRGQGHHAPRPLTPAKMDGPQPHHLSPGALCGEDRRHRGHQRRPDRHRPGRDPAAGQGLCPVPAHPVL